MFTLIRSRLSLAHWRLPNLSRALQMLALMRATRRQRQALLRLDPALLRDIGQDAASARAEASRPAWDVPAHWRR